MKFRALLISLSAVMVCACDGTVGAGEDTGPLREEAACSLPGLSRPLRQTAILIDEGSLRPAEDDAALRALNSDVLDAVMAVADPESSVASGALAPRERVSLYLAPVDGSALRLLFTGCAPSLSADERAALERNSSTLSDFTGSGAEDRIDTDAADYETMILGAIQRAAARARRQSPPRPRTFDASPLVQSLRATSRIGDPSAGLSRLVIIAPHSFSGIPAFATPTQARAAGFALASQVGLDLGLVEIDVALAPGANQRDFASAFFLASGGQLASWSTRFPTGLPRAPTAVRTFSGEIDYGPARYPVLVRIAQDYSGQLTSSWLLVRGERQPYGVPIAGAISCGGEQCRVRGDQSGFAQAWSATPGGEPEFGPDLPFGGLRNIEMIFDGPTGQGRIWDPAVDEIAGQARPEFRFQLRRGS
jgi:hypothetical protein